MVIISGVPLVDLQDFPVWHEVLWLFFQWAYSYGWSLR
jgi:hypothetical protein